jgi:hypothetical protein
MNNPGNFAPYPNEKNIPDYATKDYVFCGLCKWLERISDVGDNKHWRDLWPLSLEDIRKRGVENYEFCDEDLRREIIEKLEDNFPTEILTDEALIEIEERAKKASPGPWVVEPDLRPDIKNEKIFRAAHELEQQIDVFCYLQKKDYEKRNANIYSDPPEFEKSRQIVRDMSKNIGHVCELAKSWEEKHSNMDDAEFIAHARTDIPKLVKEIRRLKELNRAEKSK